MKNKIKRFYRRLRKHFGYRIAGIEHKCEGMQDYDREQYKENEKELEKIFQGFLNKGIVPCVGDSLFSTVSEMNYYVKNIVYYSWGVCLWVDEEEDREMED